jgi:ribosomal protein S18 acetylase RimI-like enzyme
MKENVVREESAVRLSSPLDRAALKTIVDSSFPRFFRFFASRSADSEEGKMLVAEAHNSVVGFVKLIDFYLAKHKYGCILWLAVHPKHRRQGIASALVKAGVENLKRDDAGAVFASVQRRNKASLATFAAEGFTRVGLVGLWRIFSWRVFQFYGDIWFAPDEVVLMYS